MRDDTIVRITVLLWCSAPEVHLHTAITSVRRGGKVGVIGATAILCIGQNIIIACAATSLVVGLEIARNLIESVLVRNIVYDVIPVKKVGNIELLVGNGGDLRRCYGEVRCKIERQRVGRSGGCGGKSTRTVIARSVFFGPYIISPGIVVIRRSVAVPFQAGGISRSIVPGIGHQSRRTAGMNRAFCWMRNHPISGIIHNKRAAAGILLFY